jgi:ABC-type transport system involved in multi-copper enzyme maturation permease subunit
MTSSVGTREETRARVGTADLLWLTWRQHRWAIVSGVAFVAVLGGYILWNERGITPQAYARCGGPCTTMQLFGIFSDQRGVSDLTDGIAAALGLVIAVFWAAPLLAREFEQRTNLLAWTQDVPPRRWLFSRAGWLTLAAAVLGTVLGMFVVGEADGLSGLKPSSYGEFTLLRFEAFLPLQVAYVLFGFALGLAVSALVRRVVPAMGVTAVVFLGVRFGLSQYRPYYLAPVRSISSFSSNAQLPYIGNNGLILQFGMSGANGQALDINNLACLSTVHTDAAYLACLRSGGVVGSFIDFQPDYRLTAFRYIEVAIFLVLAAALFGVVWLRMRRSTTIR